MKIFGRNPIEYEVLKDKRVAIVGVGSVGSAMAEICVRSGVGYIVLVDPEQLGEENLGRHILTRKNLGKSKSEAMAERLREINPEVHIVGSEISFQEAIDLVELKVDLVICAADSYTCQSEVNAYCLSENTPAVYICLWGGATVGEVFYWMPGLPCFECAYEFRKREDIPFPQEKYRDPSIDETRIPGMGGLWANILTICGIAFQAVLGIFGLRDVLDERNFWIFNFYEPSLQPFALHLVTVQQGCPVCDPSKLDSLHI